MLKKLTSLARREAGVTATEYALIIAVVAIIMLVGARVLGSNLNTVFSSVAGQI